MTSIRSLRAAGRLPSMWFLGMGFWWAAWSSEDFRGSSWLFAGLHRPVLMQAGFLIGTLPYALTFLLLVLLRKRLSPLRDRLSLLAGAAGVAGIGLAAVTLKSTALLGTVGSVTGLVLSQMAVALLALAWWELCGAIGARKACVGVAGSIVVGAGLHLAQVLWGPGAPLATAIFVALCPALSLASLVLAWKDPGVRPLDAAVQHESFRMPAHIMFGLFSYGFAIGFMVSLATLHPFPGSGVSLTSSLWNGGTALLILVDALARRKFDLSGLHWPILLSLAIGFMLLPIAGYGYANAVAHVGIICVTVFAMATVADIAYRVPAPALAVAGWGAFANAGGSAIGGLACAVLLDITKLSLWDLSAIAFAVVLLQMLASAPLIRGAALGSTLWGLIKETIQSPPELPVGLVEVRSAEIAAAHGLTPRECEILVLLAGGRTTDEIAKTLTISSATVRTHVKRVHEKLGVHSQPQLMRMVVFHSQDDHLAWIRSDPAA